MYPLLSCTALGAALDAWGGAVVCVSHNRAFCERFCDELWEVGGGSVRVVGRSGNGEKETFAKMFGIWACASGGGGGAAGGRGARKGRRDAQRRVPKRSATVERTGLF
jgi:hypothetical protein